jgi:hypothetical protein
MPPNSNIKPVMLVATVAARKTAVMGASCRSKIIAARTTMMEMTTRSSTSVKPLCARRLERSFISGWFAGVFWKEAENGHGGNLPFPVCSLGTI